MMKKPLLQIVTISALATVLSGCFIQVVSAPGGRVGTQSGSVPLCSEGETCVAANMDSLSFDENFIAFADPGYEFTHWKRDKSHLFGCDSSPFLPVNNAFFAGSVLEGFLALPLETFMSPVFRSTGPEIFYSTDFECNNINEGVLGDGWVSFVNIFDGNTYLGGYSIEGGAPNGEQISALATGQGGEAQFEQSLNVFSNYDSDYNGPLQHAVGQQVEVNVFQEYTLAPGSEGTYTFTFDAKLPPESAVEFPSTANAFVKVLDPANGYQTVAGTLDAFDSTNLTTEWSTQSVTVVITVGMANAFPTALKLQFGFQNTATDYNNSGVTYDNVVFRKSL